LGEKKMQAQRKRNTSRSTAITSTPGARPEYTAAVRYLDGRRDIFHVRYADNMADARAVVLAEPMMSNRC
jgi:hypothetical protein